MSFELIVELYKKDPYFATIYEECTKGAKEGYFGRRDSCLKLANDVFLLARLERFWCVKLIEAVLLVIFGEKKTLEALKEHFYWPAMIHMFTES